MCSDVSLASSVDGKMLLLLTEEDLLNVFHMSNRFHRKQLLLKISNLKIRTDYSNVDPTDLNGWLADIGQEFKQYTYNLLQAGVDRDFLQSVTEAHLEKDCQVLIRFLYLSSNGRSDYERCTSYQASGSSEERFNSSKPSRRSCC